MDRESNLIINICPQKVSIIPFRQQYKPRQFMTIRKKNDNYKRKYDMTDRNNVHSHSINTRPLAPKHQLIKLQTSVKCSFTCARQPPKECHDLCNLKQLCNFTSVYEHLRSMSYTRSAHKSRVQKGVYHCHDKEILLRRQQFNHFNKKIIMT